MNILEIGAKCDELNIRVRIERSDASWHNERDPRWTAYFEGHGDGTTIETHYSSSTLEDAVIGAWEKFEALIQRGVPQMAQALITHEGD